MLKEEKKILYFQENSPSNGFQNSGFVIKPLRIRDQSQNVEISSCSSDKINAESQGFLLGYLTQCSSHRSRHFSFSFVFLFRICFGWENESGVERWSPRFYFKFDSWIEGHLCINNSINNGLGCCRSGWWRRAAAAGFKVVDTWRLWSLRRCQ